ncbi:hypothetical protein [Candidatus Binatus sp.]|jgi:hypothetical protein|uniref:hypothetical protein n=1 Tax=Candidatus Binatus sp. TaxID=2811406 RepID=UPI003BE9DB3B
MYKSIGLLTVVAIVAVVGYHLYGARCGQKPGIISEDIKGSGDNWDADFKARVSALEKDVFRAMENVENAKSDQILNVKVLSSQGNTKTVEVDFAGPTGASVPTKFAFQYFAGQNRITYKSLDSQVFQSDGDCRLQAECAATLIECRQLTKLLQQRPLTDGVIKENLRQLFVAQLDGLHRALHVQIPDRTDEDDDEP